MNKFFALFYLTLLCVGCSDSKKTECLNADRFIYWEDETSTVDFKFNTESVLFLKVLNNKLGNGCLQKDCMFGLRLTNDKVYTMFHHERRKNFDVSCLKIDYGIDVLINKHGDLLVDGDLMTIEQLIKVEKNWEDAESQKKRFELYWDSQTPPDELNKVFEVLEMKYKRWWNEKSMELFNKEFCAINTNQAAVIHDEMPFKIKLRMNPPLPNLSIPLKIIISEME